MPRWLLPSSRGDRMCCEPKLLLKPCSQVAVLNNLKSPTKYCMGFMLLCCMKYKEPGSAKHDVQKSLGRRKHVKYGEENIFYL